MNAVDKELLLKDLCFRLPYKCKYYASMRHIRWYQRTLCTGTIDNIINDHYEEIKPYLRPMSDMTEEEKKEYYHMSEVCVGYDDKYSTIAVFDWLNKHHFDYRGLIEKGLAIAVTEDNDPYE